MLIAMVLNHAKWNVLVFLLLGSWVCIVLASVSYDQKAIIIDGKRRILISGSIHYPRSTPEMWPELIQNAKGGGLDVIQTYVFWNGHEPSPGKYYFEENYDLVKFIKLVKEAGLYVHLRIGPYVCAEWNFGGFPVWLNYIPGVEFRTDNEPFKQYMESFTRKIVNMMKAERLFKSQGGPIILSQIENEYGPIEKIAGSPGQAYAKWAAKMALGLGTNVPWIMCKQDDAPDPVINTCNGFYCDYFSPNKDNKPKMWTEAWTGWFTGFGTAVPYRPAEDLAFSVVKFILKGGSFINYYMLDLVESGLTVISDVTEVPWGTNFGRTSGGPYVATSYDYDAPLDEYGLLRQPKWGHLKDLHVALKVCEPALLSGELTQLRLGQNQKAHVFKSKSGACAAFLANYDSRSSATVAFGNMHHSLPPWCISILPGCKYTVYNTARVGAQSAQMKMIPVPAQGGFSWEAYSEEPASEFDNSFTITGLLEQINTTKDTSDYLWYTTEVSIDASEEFLKSKKYPVLTVTSASHAMHVFVNGVLSGTAFGGLDSPTVSFSDNVKLQADTNKISLLSITVGLPNIGPHFETWNEGRRDLSWEKWSYKIGLRGEDSYIHSLSGTSSVDWAEESLVARKQPLTWYKTTFDAPAGNAPLALDMTSMVKGQVWINGRSIGRYWPGYQASGNCSECDYAGTYNEKKCLRNCGKASQRWYHVPRSWLKPTRNLLVVFEEWGGDPNGIVLVKREVDSVCADFDEWQPTFSNWHRQASGKINNPLRPKAHLSCGEGQKISSIKFASFGTPEGVCGSYHTGTCHAKHTYHAFEKLCVGQNFCSVTVAPETFGGDPCPNVNKKLSVEAVCT